MCNADGEVAGQTRRAALQAARMNELDTLELDEESQEGLSSVTVLTQLVPPSPPILIREGNDQRVKIAGINRTIHAPRLLVCQSAAKPVSQTLAAFSTNTLPGLMASFRIFPSVQTEDRRC